MIISNRLNYNATVCICNNKLYNWLQSFLSILMEISV